jgi:opacity protein-like surface antigen
MKRLYILLYSLIIICRVVSAQTTEPSGKAITEIFTDFHININDAARHTGFDLNRAYLGYQFMPGGNLTGKIIINAGSPDDVSIDSKQRRYAFFREASISWSNEKLIVTMGMTGTRIFEFQQRFWGKRYIANTYQSINGYGFVADLGVAVDYQINKIFRADFTLMNGEGYLNLQADDNLRGSLGLTITPDDNIAIRIYGDIQRQRGLWQPVAVAFAGFKNDLFNIGGEVSWKSNIDVNQGHHAWGVSATGSINITEKIDVFGRYDYSSSVRLQGDPMNWNYLQDGSFAIAGVEYSFSQNIKVALNYQGTYPYAKSGSTSNLIYLNALFRF